MFQINTHASIKGGVVVLLLGTVFIGMCMGYFAYTSSNLLGPNQASAQIGISDDASTVLVTVHALGDYEKLTITVNNSSETVTETGEYEFSKSNTGNTTLVIEGHINDKTEILREETF